MFECDLYLSIEPLLQLTICMSVSMEAEIASVPQLIHLVLLQKLLFETIGTTTTTTTTG